MHRHRLATALALAAAACAALAAAAFAAGGHGRLYVFRGELASTAAGSLTLTVDGGNHDALKALIGHSQDESFTVGGRTQVLVAHGAPRVASVADLHPGDRVEVRIRAPRGASLAQLASRPAATVVDHARPPHPSGALYLYVGTVAGPQSGTRVALHVTSGNWHGLRSLLGQSLDQTFATDAGTIYLLWQGKVPSVIAPSQLKAGDRITVRVRAPGGTALAQIEATPAAHVGDHEPGDPATES